MKFRTTILRIVLALALILRLAPALASQATLVTPGPPLPMTGLASFLNAAFLSIGSCNSGNSAPVNGTGGAAFAGECWINTTSNPWVFSYYDGANWVEFGSLNTSTHVWTGINCAPASGTCLDDITGFSSTGFLTRTGAGTYVFQSLANGITLGNLPQLNAGSFWANPGGSSANAEQVTLDSSLSWVGTTIKCTLASATQIGCGEPDNVTIQISGGKWVAVGAVTTSVDAAGATAISNGVNGDLLGEASGKIANFALGSGLTLNGATINATYQRPETGSVLEDIYMRLLTDSVSVLDFGAVMDGSNSGGGTDNTTAFQNAANAAVCSSGILFVPGGGVFTVKSLVTIVPCSTNGNNHSLVVMLAPDSDTAFNSANGLYFFNGSSGGGISGGVIGHGLITAYNGGSNGGFAIHLLGGGRFTVADVRMPFGPDGDNVQANGILIDGSEHWTVYNNYIGNCYQTCIEFQATGSTNQTTEGYIVRNELAGPVGLAGGGAVWAHIVPNATFTGTGSGTNLTASSVTGTINAGDGITGTGVPSNTYIVSQTSGTPGGAGVYVTNNATTSFGASLTALGAGAMTNVLIQGNHFEASDGGHAIDDGIRLDPTNLSNVRVLNNLFHSNAGDTFNYDIQNNANAAIIGFNQFWGSLAAATNIYTAGPGTSIIGNQAWQDQAVLGFIEVDVAATNSLVADNAVVDSGVPSSTCFLNVNSSSWWHDNNCYGNFTVGGPVPINSFGTQSAPSGFLPISGLIVQTGKVSLNGTSTVTINFPKAFPNNCVAVIGNLTNQQGTVMAGCTNVSTGTATFSTSGTPNMNYIALGN